MSTRKPNATPAPAAPAASRKIDPYHALEPIPQPDVQERSTDTVWALWSEVRENEHKRYADTQPMTRPGAKAPPMPLRAAAPPPATNGVDKLVDESRRNNRVCPKLEHWQRLDALLRSKAPDAAAKLPKPVPARDMQVMPALARRTMFRGVIDWASAHGATEDVLQFVRALPEGDWHHLGE